MIIDVTSGGPDVRAALVEMSGDTSGKTSGGEPPSTIPVLVIGAGEALGEFDGPGTALPKPAEKRALLESTRTLVEGARRKWSRRTRT